ncbi:MAG: glycoside hydrolase family 5 protein [Dictyoglomus sp.]|nr:glycoside hydrolase family 5 protein [Dictyoglomus sp.]MDW8188485.1 glycoside hydrolase family 5 protein [Dictyoglomus sp.]
MKKLLVLSFIFLIFLGRTSAMEKLPILRGVNMGNALEAPFEGQWGVVIKDEYFSLIRSAGFDHVRIPVRWNAYAEYKPPYKISPYIFERVDHVIKEAFKNNLYVIINIHHYEEIMQEPEKHKERFLKLWEQISEHYKDYPETLYFELLNEPCMNLKSNLWNEYLMEAVKIVRKTNPTRKIIIGPTDWNNIYRLNELKIPQGDKNIIVTFHYYNPFNFTHQGAEWVNPSPPVGVKWLGTEAEKKAIERELDMVVDWSKRNGNPPLYMGEFGAYSKADMESRVRWTSFVARSAEKRGIAWSYWEFCSGFGIYDPLNKKWRIDLLKALIPDTKIKE